MTLASETPYEQPSTDIMYDYNSKVFSVPEVEPLNPPRPSQ